jgi:DNA-binding MarR family transcriptional regulator
LSSKKETTAALSDAIARYQAAVDDFDRECARVLGVNETDLRCLEILIREQDEATPRLLADQLGLTTGSVTTMLDRLEKMNYVARRAHPTDRRKVIVSATAEASRRAGDLIGPLIADGNEFLRGYSVAQLESVREFLTRTTELQQRHTARLRQTARD